MQKTNRQLSPYEKNQLRKYQIPESKLIESEMPVEYLTGHVEFCALDLLVNQNVLIPRVETEELVDHAVAFLQSVARHTSKNNNSLSSFSELKIIDIATGSGAIITATAKKILEQNDKINNKIILDIFATDISEKALEVAQTNFANILPNKNITIIKSNLLEQLAQTDISFDLIVSNLPYIPTERIKTLDESVKGFEPHLALDGGNDGFELINKLLLQIKEQNKLTENGAIFLEMDISHNFEVFQKYHLDEIYDIFIFQDQLEGVNFAKITWKK